MASREAAESIVNPVKTRLADLENAITNHEKSSYRVILAVGATAMEIHSDPIGPEQSVMNWDTGDGTFDFRHAGNRLWLTTTSVDRKILRHTTAS